ncbi:MAG: ribulose-phosphate 3-epimerase [Candidatus Izemoplasmatales bacterium]
MKVAPSFLTCDFNHLESEIRSINKASWLHFDVMDGKFVPAKTYDHHMLETIREFSDQYFDCHLMMDDPIPSIKDYALSGADSITFHYESDPSRVKEAIDEIKKYGKKVGISIKPLTDIQVIFPYLDQLDLILIMSVEPGKGGQKFIPESLDKIKLLDEMRKQNHYHYIIEVDGGINQDTSKLVKDAGIDVAVVGSFIFNQVNRNELIEQLENE